MQLLFRIHDLLRPITMADSWKRTIWQAWLGSREMPGVLVAAHETVIARAGRGMRVRLLRDADVVTLLPNVVRNPAYAALTPIHRSDYVRAALLHEYGGIWLDTDAFVIGRNLSAAVDQCEDSGRRVPTQQGVIGPLRPNTTITTAWLRLVEETLASNLDRILGRANLTSRSLAGAALPTPVERAPMQGDCGLATLGACRAWGRQAKLPWGFLLGRIWNDLASRFGHDGPEEYHSMSCDDPGACLRCCAVHADESFACALTSGERVGERSRGGTARGHAWAIDRPGTCNARRVLASRPATVVRAHERRTTSPTRVAPTVPYGAAHVMLSLSSHMPLPIKALSRDAFLRSSALMAARARELLGVLPSDETVRAIEGQEGCLTRANLSALTRMRGHGELDALLEPVVKRWGAAER